MSVTFSSGQTTVLSSSVSGLVVPDGATLEVVGGGIATAATVAAGGSAIVIDGGAVSSAVLAPGVSVPGTVGLLAGGKLTVASGGTATATNIGFIASETVQSGGIDRSANAGAGEFSVLAGGSAIDTQGSPGSIISSGGTELLGAGGSAAGIDLLSGAVFSAPDGGSTSNLRIGSGFVFSVTSGLRAGFTAVASGGQEIVVSGGSASMDRIAAGGTETILAGGSSFMADLAGSVSAYLGAGGSFDYTPILAKLVVSSGGIANMATLEGDAEERVLAGGSDSGTTIASASVLFVASGGSASNEGIGPAGILDLGAGAIVSGAIRFTSAGLVGGSGGDSELVISGTTLPDVVLSGFDVNGVSQGDTIDLPDVAFTSTGSATIDAAGSLLSVVAGGATYDLRLAQLPNVDGERFTLAPDAQGGTEVFAAVACFAAGTRLATPEGWVEVERLVPGDRLRRADGRIERTVWIGHRRIDCARHGRSESVWPVRIAPHAFGLGRPGRPVRLSPDHAVFIDGVLIPVRYLLNAATVAQEAVRRITYFHVELPAHGVLLAEGLPAESYLDTGNRANFANAGTVIAARPDFARAVWAKAGCAPLVTDGPMFDRIRRRLIAQALALGWRPESAETPDHVTWRAPPGPRRSSLRTA